MENIFSQWDAGLYETYLNDFKLEHKKLIKDYSRGMKMKLQIAVALSHRAKILIFDEATSGLDPLVRDDLLDILLEYIQDAAGCFLWRIKTRSFTATVWENVPKRITAHWIKKESCG